VPELIENAGRAEHSMLDLNTWGRKTGLVVDRPENIQSAVALSALSMNDIGLDASEPAPNGTDAALIAGF